MPGAHLLWRSCLQRQPWLQKLQKGPAEKDQIWQHVWKSAALEKCLPLCVKDLQLRQHPGSDIHCKVLEASLSMASCLDSEAWHALGCTVDNENDVHPSHTHYHMHRQHMHSHCIQPCSSPLYSSSFFLIQLTSCPES